jgi:hypothetical protein
MARHPYETVYLFQFGAIRRIRAYPTRQGTMWRDEMGLEYPNRMIKLELTPAEAAIFDRCEADRQADRAALQKLIHPENYEEA